MRSRGLVLRAARALSATRFNSIPEPGTDRDVARKVVQAACADLAKLYQEFDAAVVGIEFGADAAMDVGTLLAANRALIGVLEQYRSAFEGQEFAAINEREKPATKEWDKAVQALLARVDPGATAAPTPTATA